MESTLEYTYESRNVNFKLSIDLVSDFHIFTDILRYRSDNTIVNWRPMRAGLIKISIYYKLVS